MTIIFDGVIIRNVFDYNFINVEVAGLISNILDVPDTDEDMRKEVLPKGYFDWQDIAWVYG